MQNRAKHFLLFSLLIIAASLVAFWAGSLHYRNQYTHSLIAVKHIDGKYGDAFYAVEVTGAEHHGHIEVYAKIFIGSFANGYYHDCGNIGTGKTWTHARKQFGDIQFGGKTITIGPYQIERSKYENHR